MQDRIEPVYARDILVSADLADSHPGISARDRVQIAPGAGHGGADRNCSLFDV